LAAVVLVLVANGEAQTPAVEALARAVRGGLGAGAVVRVREAAPPASEEALGDAADDASTVAAIHWLDSERMHASLRIRVAGSRQVIERELVFSAVDAPEERGRTLGLLIVALVPEPAPPVPVPVAERPAEPRAGPPRFSLAAGATAAVGMGGRGGGLGGTAAAGLRLGTRWELRLMGLARAAEVSEAQASSRTLGAGVGVDVQALAQHLPWPALRIRFDALLCHQSLSHFSMDDPAPVRQGRTLPGGHLMAELSWPVSGGASLTLAGGAEALLGTIDVSVGGETVTALAPMRLLIEAGLRVGL
jgi:hypothetical protein